jgi:hypothetical protein
MSADRREESENGALLLGHGSQDAVVVGRWLSYTLERDAGKVSKIADGGRQDACAPSYARIVFLSGCCGHPLSR